VEHRIWVPGLPPRLTSHSYSADASRTRLRPLDSLPEDAPWLARIGAIRANASTKSHPELDEATELDPGDSIDLGARCSSLSQQLPNLTVFGGCCGTDYRHVAAIKRPARAH